MASEPIPVEAADVPVEEAERLVTLDFIRGIAVLGILVANIVAFSAPVIAYSWPGGYPHPPTRTDAWIWLIQYVLIDGKMRGLFSLLFGAGMMLFLERARTHGATAWLQVRRLVWLIGFGLLHFYLLFWGDILFLYGLAGLVALLFVRQEPHKLLGLGIAWYLAGSLYLTAMASGSVTAEGAHAGPAHAQAVQGAAQAVADAGRELRTFMQGDYPAEVAFVAREHSAVLRQYPLFAALETVPWMLIGMGLYGVRLFDGRFDRRLLQRWGGIGVVGGAALTAVLGLLALGEGFPFYLTRFVFDDIGELPRLPMTLGLTALLIAWAPIAARGWLGERLIAAGRMAFSNYVGTSALMMLIFRHWALGFYGELDRVQLLIPMTCGWVLILAWSKPWLAHFRYGPLEWCWRCLTYWRLFPFRRHPRARAAKR